MTATGRDRADEGERFAHIDCLRAIAAFSVVVWHFKEALINRTSPTAWVRAVDTTLADHLDLGRLGVLLFFIISGYCIANSILRPALHPVLGFAIKRAMRLYPAYWLSLAAAVLLYGLPAKEAILVHATLLQTFLGQTDLLGIYWTLAVELSFYGLCVALFVFGIIGNRRRLQGVWLALVGYCVIAASVRAIAGLPLPYAWPWFLSLMVGGALLRQIADETAPGSRRILVFTAVTLAAALFIALCIYGNPETYQKSWQQDFFANAAAVLLFVVFDFGYRPRWRFGAFLGRISYSVYLFHVVVLELTVRALNGPLSATGAIGPVYLLVFLVAATIAVASATYALVELPGIEMGQRMNRALNRLRLEPARK